MPVNQPRPSLAPPLPDRFAGPRKRLHDNAKSDRLVAAGGRNGSKRAVVGWVRRAVSGEPSAASLGESSVRRKSGRGTTASRRKVKRFRSRKGTGTRAPVHCTRACWMAASPWRARGVSTRNSGRMSRPRLQTRREAVAVFRCSRGRGDARGTCRRSPACGRSRVQAVHVSYAGRA